MPGPMGIGPFERLKPDAGRLASPVLRGRGIGNALLLPDKAAASSVQQGLTVVIDELKAENLNDAQGLASKSGVLTNEFRIAILAARNEKGPASFLDIVEAHITLQSIIPAPANVVQLNSTLDALVAANKSLASATNEGAIPEISDLVSRAQESVALFNSFKQ